jgi:hypothetical protein
MKLTRNDIEVIAMILGRADTGLAAVERLTIDDAEAVASFIGVPLEKGPEVETTGEMRDRLKLMRADISRVRNKLKTLYGV